MLRPTPIFVPRTRRTALAGWRVPSRRRPALRDCSLIIPASDRDPVEPLLDALLAIPDAPGEVVVVDAGPAHGLGPRLRAWSDRAGAPFALVYVASPPGLTRQRNIGVDIATRDFLFFLDPGVEPLPGYFAIARRVFDIDREGCVGGVAGMVVNGPRLPLLSRLYGRLDPLTYTRSGACRRHVPLFSGLRRVDVVPGCACVWRREVFAARRFSCYFHDWPEGEDVEMSLRAGKSWTLLCCGEARVKRVADPPPPGYHAGRARIRNRHFVWKRHVARPHFRHAARFWLDAVLDAAAALASARLRYAAGILAGIASCLADPPRFIDPPARREYVLAPETLAAETLAAQTGN